MLSERLVEREEDMEQLRETLDSMVTQEDRQVYSEAEEFCQHCHEVVDSYWTVKGTVDKELGRVDSKVSNSHTPVNS